MWPENAKGNSVFAFRKGLETENWFRSTEADHKLFRDAEKQETGRKVIFHLGAPFPTRWG